MGGVSDPDNVFKKLDAKLWDGSSPHLPEDLGVVATGPVGFAADGTPLQLVVDKQENSLTLMNLARREPIQRFVPPGGLAPADTDELSPATMLPDGTRVAASVRQPDGRYQAIVWDGLTGREIARVTLDARTLRFRQTPSCWPPATVTAT